MSKFTQKELEGSLWRNKKIKDEKSPSHVGQCKIGFEDYWISAWVNELPETGEKYFRLKFKKKDER